MKSKNLLAIAAFALGAQALQAAPTFVPVNSNITSDTTWTRDKVYVLNKVIFIGNGATLTVEPGTVIRGINSTQSGLSGAPGTLVVQRDANLVAMGTPDDPITMTSLQDPNVPGGVATIPASGALNNSLGNPITYTAEDYNPDGPNGNNGFRHLAKWGGVVILGNAYVAQNTNGLSFPYGVGSLVAPTARDNGTGQDFIEGLEPTNLNITPVGGTAALPYGGVDDNDDSGTLQWVSIRYAGFQVGANNELNSLTVGGLGEGTVLEFVECAFNEDDGFEFFGGANSARFLFSNYISDDSFDGDEGYRGTHQFLFAIQGLSGTGAGTNRVGFTLNEPVGHSNTSGNTYDHCFEFDGPEPNSVAEGVPGDLVTVWNSTLLSAGADEPFRIRERANFACNNSIFHLRSGATRALVEMTADTTNDGTVLDLSNVTYSGPTIAGALGTGVLNQTNVTPSVTKVAGAGYYTKNGVDPRQASPTSSLVLPPAGFVQANYQGFQVNNTFLSGWSVMEALQVLPTSNLTRPVVSLGVSGSNPTVSFPSVSGVRYVVEKLGSDGKTWAPVNGGALTSGTGSTVTVTDTGTVLVAGSPVQYRVFGL